MTWCPWYQRTGEKVRHKQSGKTGEVVWHHLNALGDVEVVVDGSGGTPVTWFGQNVEYLAPDSKGGGQ